MAGCSHSRAAGSVSGNEYGQIVTRWRLQNARSEVDVRRSVFSALIGIEFGTSAHAQTTTQVWPEISAFTRLNDRMRFYFLATTVKESQQSTEGEFNPNFDFYLRPF